MDRNNDDAISIRSYRSSTSGTVSEAGRTEAMSLARPRTDQEIEDRFLDFMVSPKDTRLILDNSRVTKQFVFIHERSARTIWACMSLNRGRE